MRLRFVQKCKKMYELNKGHPQAQPNCTCSYVETVSVIIKSFLASIL